VKLNRPKSNSFVNEDDNNWHFTCFELLELPSCGSPLPLRRPTACGRTCGCWSTPPSARG